MAEPAERDWLGHAIQVGALLAVIGVPMIVWGVSINGTILALAKTVERQEKDIADQRTFQLLVTGQLSKIDTQLGDIRDSVRLKR